MDLGRTVLLLALVALAGAYDVRRRTIPNWLTLAGFLAGLALTLPAGFRETAAHLAGALLVLAAGTALFARRWIGGGDVKLLTALAVILGPWTLPELLLYTCLAGAALALVQTARERMVLPALLDTRDALAYCLTLGRAGRRLRELGGAAVTMPYAVPIGLGAVSAWLL